MVKLIMINKKNQFLKRVLSVSFLGILAIAIGMIAWDKNVEEVIELNVMEVSIQHPDDVLQFSDSLVQPVLYQNVDQLDTLEGKQLKQKFIEVILPAVLIAKFRIEKQRERLVRMNMMDSWTDDDSLFYQDLSSEYKADNLDELILKLHTHPNSVVLAQAAMESGWGTSRFFREANNLFGVWSFNPNEPRMQASGSRNGRAIYVRKYNDLSQSIEDYFKVLARSDAYKTFRQERIQSEEPLQLVNHLVKYSEKRWEYVRLLKVIIRKNDLQRYDEYQLSPQFIVQKREYKWWS